MELDLNLESVGMKLVVLVKKESIYSLYFGPVEDWILDHFSSFDSFDEEYFKYIQPYKVGVDVIRKQYALIREREDFSKSEIQSYFVPLVIIDFDAHEYLSNFYDQALENRMVEGWKGLFIEAKKEFLNQIPIDYKYWDNHFDFSTNDQ